MSWKTEDVAGKREEAMLHRTAQKRNKPSGDEPAISDTFDYRYASFAIFYMSRFDSNVP